MLPHVLICTVGTSLFYPNLASLKPDRSYRQDPAQGDVLGQADRKTLEAARLWPDDSGALRAVLADLKADYQDGIWSRLGARLTALPPDLRLCGAEINSIAAMVRKGFLPKNRARLVCLVSDTPEGRAAGEVLSSYFSHKRCAVGFGDCRYRVVEGLQDEKPLTFATEGLCNLVRVLGHEMRKWGENAMAINATGGYKAQIALAVAFGQATHCPVYYKHERFDQIIRFPRIPFTIDLSLVGRDIRLWATLAEPDCVLTEEQLKELISPDSQTREAVEPLLESLEEGGKRFFALSALGLVYWEAYLCRQPNRVLQPQRTGTRKGVRFTEHHWPKGFEEYVVKVYDTHAEWISECHDIPYSGQQGIKSTRFYLRGNRLIGEYVDRAGFGARFEVLSSAANGLERRWLLERLNRWLREKG